MPFLVMLHKYKCCILWPDDCIKSMDSRRVRFKVKNMLGEGQVREVFLMNYFLASLVVSCQKI